MSQLNPPTSLAGGRPMDVEPRQSPVRELINSMHFKLNTVEESLELLSQRLSFAMYTRPRCQNPQENPECVGSELTKVLTCYAVRLDILAGKIGILMDEMEI